MYARVECGGPTTALFRDSTSHRRLSPGIVLILFVAHRSGTSASIFQLIPTLLLGDVLSRRNLLSNGVVSRHSFSFFSHSMTAGFDRPAVHEVTAARVNARLA